MRKTLLAAAAFYLTTSPSFAYQIADIQFVDGYTCSAVIVTPGNGSFSLYDGSPPWAFAALSKAQGQYDQYIKGLIPFSSIQLVWWDVGPADPNCGGLRMIQHVRYTR